MQVLRIIFILLVLSSCEKDSPKIDVNPGEGLTSAQTIEKLYDPDPNYVLIASHRGDATKAPENTIAAVMAAIDGGAEIVEIDVRRTSDGHLVVIHDSDLERTTNGSGKITDRTLSFIKSLRTKDSQGNLTDHEVPTLKELMLFAKDKALIFIDKGEDYWEQIHQILVETETLDHALVVENYSLARARSEMGTALFEGVHYVCRLRETDKDANDLFDDFIDEVIPGFEFRFESENASILKKIEEVKFREKHVWMSTLNSSMAAGRTDSQALLDPQNSWGWCIENGATILLTDYPDRLAEYLRTINKRSK